MECLIEKSELKELIESSSLVLIKCAIHQSMLMPSIANSYGILVSNLTELLNNISRINLEAESTVVLYDDGDFEPSAKVWWCLKSIGKTSRILNGGISNWSREELVEETPSEINFEQEVWHIVDGNMFKDMKELFLLDRFDLLHADFSFQKLFSKKKLHKTKKIVKALQDKKVNFDDSLLSVTHGELPFTVLFLLTLFGRKNISALIDAPRNDSLGTEFYSMAESFPKIEMNKRFSESARNLVTSRKKKEGREVCCLIM